jgi:UDP-glucose 4-epimerase
VDVNGINKMAGESYHVLYHDVYGLRTCALRLTNTYGPRMRIRDTRQTFLGAWIRSLVEGHPFEVWEGHQRRDFNYVDDVVEALFLAATSDDAIGRIFNLGSDEVVTLLQLAEILREIDPRCSFSQCSFPNERKRIDIGDYYADFTLFHKLLGWRPRVSLREGLGQTVNFYRQNLKHYL